MKPASRRQFLERSAIAGASLLACPDTRPAANPAPPPRPRTAVRRHRGRPAFFLDGQPYTKPVFETYVPQPKYFRPFTEAGTEVFSFPTNLGPGFGTPTWLGPDQWGFEAIDTPAARVLGANPRGLLRPHIDLTTPEGYHRSIHTGDLVPETMEVFLRAAKKAGGFRKAAPTGCWP